MTPRAFEIVKSIRRFGVVHGVWNLFLAAVPWSGTVDLWIDRDHSVKLRRRTSDWETFAEVFLDECYRDDFTALFGSGTDRISVESVIDAGANVGYSAVYFDIRYPNASIVAIEPDPENYGQLVTNVAALSSVRPVHGALWDAHVPLSLVEDDCASNSIRVSASEVHGRAPVQGYAMNELIDMLPVRYVDVLKVDVEGAERTIFGYGAQAWLGKVRLILIELHDWKSPGSSRQYHAALRGFDYSEYSLAGVLGTVVHGKCV